jgi:hypothetical protein
LCAVFEGLVVHNMNSSHVRRAEMEVIDELIDESIADDDITSKSMAAS